MPAYAGLIPSGLAFRFGLQVWPSGLKRATQRRRARSVRVSDRGAGMKFPFALRDVADRPAGRFDRSLGKRRRGERDEGRFVRPGVADRCRTDARRYRSPVRRFAICATAQVQAQPASPQLVPSGPAAFTHPKTPVENALLMCTPGRNRSSPACDHGNRHSGRNRTDAAHLPGGSKWQSSAECGLRRSRYQNNRHSLRIPILPFRFSGLGKATIIRVLQPLKAIVVQSAPDEVRSVTASVPATLCFAPSSPPLPA